MPLGPGARLGPYEIVAAIGAGGMGEVYRARDTRLQRDVAIKVLPELFANDPERVARLQREAQILASLNHPNIAAIYGFEYAGPVHALALEFVEGPTLADQLAKGPIPLAEALPIARQIAEALEAAHGKAIIHRDLKPANIKLRPDGSVKVLDFGLAKATEGDTPIPALSSLSPTFTSPVATRIGMILGTATYMSPEQARGKALDKRSDIWSFGCVLYEMMTGRPPFDGEEVSDVLARIIEREADFGALPPSTPAPIRRLLQRCLEKDRYRRLPDIGVARLEIDDAMMLRGGAEPVAGQRLPARWFERLAWLAVGAGTAGLIAGAVIYSRGATSASRGIVHASIPLTQPLDTWRKITALAISPDGSRIVYRPFGEGPLYTRLLNESEASAISGTDGAVNPFFSPDGASLAFFSGSELKKFAFAGGATSTVARLPVDVAPIGYRGGTWGDNGDIVFAPSTGAGLFRVAAGGETVEALTRLGPNETNHRWPQLLSGGKAVLFTIKTTNLQSFDDAQIVVRALDSGEQHAIAQGDSARYVETGHIVYARAGALFAVPFDADRLAVTGAPVKLLDGVAMHPSTGAAQFAISRSGTLLYAAADPHVDEEPLLWIDRDGKAEQIGSRMGEYWLPRVSPDGRRVALFVDGAYGKIWVVDLSRGTFTRASQLGGDQATGQWMPDGLRLVLSADVTGTGIYRMFVDRVDASDTATPLSDGVSAPSVETVSPDGGTVLFWRGAAATGGDVWAYSFADRKAIPFLQGAANERSSAFSPDGRWIAYVSDESGRAEVYVRPFPGAGTRYQISADGGVGPAWARNGRELFFAKGDTLFTVPVTLGATFSSGAARRLLSGPYDFGDVRRNYDVSPDGQHFVAPRTPMEKAPRRLELVLNWTDDVIRQAR